MEVFIRKYNVFDIKNMVDIWNEIVNEGNSFPQNENLDFICGEKFFEQQTYCAVAEDSKTNEIMGLYILHPNNIGRCCHIANASYAVTKRMRGKGVGRALVIDSLVSASKYGFKVMQFNAVVVNNYRAIRLYKNLGFTQLGKIPNGFKLGDDTYEDIYLFYYDLQNLKCIDI